MKTPALVMLMMTAAIAWAGATAAQDVIATNPAPHAGAKVINDPAEYKAFTDALGQADPAQQAAAMEAFVAAYPNSAAKLVALEQALGAYLKVGNTAKVASVAQTILDAEPGNLRVLAILITFERGQATVGDTSVVASLGEHADKGLAALPRWTKPAGMDDDAYKTLRDTMTVIFQGAHGFVLLQAKDFDGARKAYLKALALEPTNMQDAYQVGVAEMQTTPLRISGFWWLARAVDLAGGPDNARVQQAIATYAKGKYLRYHGSDGGWDMILVDATTEQKPPDDFAVKAAPAP